MIYTITFNPALDYTVAVDSFAMGMTNRTTEELVLPGGKGVNVSVVLRNLGWENTALGFIAGFTGEEIKKRLEEAGCITDFIAVKSGMSRINVKIRNEEGTEINGMGPDIDAESLKMLFARIDKLCPGDVLVLAGSIPASIPDSIYRDIMALLADREILIVVDAVKELLVNVLEYHPFLIKPNHHELGEIFGVTVRDKEDIICYGRKLQDMGARNVLISMAGEGAVLMTDKGEIYTRQVPEGKLVNAVGAGDSMVAGFLSGYLETGDYEASFLKGIAAGSASAFSLFLATKEEVGRLLRQMERQEFSLRRKCTPPKRN